MICGMILKQHLIQLDSRTKGAETSEKHSLLFHDP